MHSEGRKNYLERLSFWLLPLSIADCLFFFTGNVLIKDVYKNAIIGAVFEFLWLPAVILLFAVPVICVVLLIKGNTPLWPIVVSLLFSALTFGILFV